MFQRVARTQRYLARLISQETARTNAAQGSADLRRRRDEQEYVGYEIDGAKQLRHLP
jgi:hypothetical protein